MKLSDAVKTLTKALKEDSGLYYAYQANIAMAFKDELDNKGYKLPDSHEIANNAAKNFLDLLIYMSDVKDRGEYSLKVLPTCKDCGVETEEGAGSARCEQCWKDKLGDD